MSLLLLCDIAKQNTTASRNVTKTCKVYDCLLAQMIDASTSDTDRMCILQHSLIIDESNFQKQLTSIPTIAKDLQTCFNVSKYSKYTQLVVNIYVSLVDEDIDNYIMPMLSVSTISSDTAIKLFRKILTTKGFRKMGQKIWEFSELQNLLENSDKRNYILQL